MKSNIDHRRLARLRRGQGEIANHIIDELAAGRLSRRDFIRRASVVGILRILRRREVRSARCERDQDG